MWVGSHLSKLELLTLHSFLHYGHEFHLWAYDDIRTPLPKGVVLEDAAQIIPRKDVFRKSGVDRECGVGKGSFGAPFSDLFRYKLLYEHGGYWVDMDVTCLRPFDFEAEYLFRPHRVGVVGNILKCPPRSPLMLATYESVVKEASGSTEWLWPNRVLSENVRRMGLEGFIRSDICNEDSWWHAIKPLVEQFSPLPFSWYAIHWINEFWRTLATDQGRYKGEQILDDVPDKERPKPGSTMEALYRKYDLLPLPEPVASPKPTVTAKPAARPAPAFPAVQIRPHLNILMPSLTRGGAERSVLDALQGLRRSGGTANLFLLYDTLQGYELSQLDHVQIVRLAGEPEAHKFRTIALQTLASPVPVVYTHMVGTQKLRLLWELGVQTVPVIQNSQPSWQDPPTAFDHPLVPFVVSVSEDVARQMRTLGCPKPVVTIRHELQRAFTPQELQRSREAIRRQYGIRSDTLLIGMVGQFKAQKAYTRAVRVLHLVQQACPAKLMILGGWDHAHGAGRAAYTAACRQALDLGVMADMIMPGNVDPVEPYYAAFDVFLNTSIYEGLSVATLEAVQSGCLIVSADAGGNREALPPQAAVIEDTSDIEAYAAAILRLVEQSWRVVPPPPPDPDLVPRLWAMTARHGVPQPDDHAPTRTGTLFLTNNLNFGGPQRSLVNLLSHLPPEHKSFLGIVDQAYREEFVPSIAQAQVPIIPMNGKGGILDKSAEILAWADALRIANICFWNVDARVKLLLAKILEVRPLRLIDASPGPMLFEELRSARTLQSRASLSEGQYWERLDCFVTKYSGGIPGGMASEKVTRIPNGVPVPPGELPLPPELVRLPKGANPAFAIGTCCRIVPSKRVEFLLEMMAVLTKHVPEASLTIVGSVDPRHVLYWNSLVDKLEETGLTNVYFAGGHEDVRPFLQQFQAFVMISDNQGCPNASLEALAMGLPVVANASGGTAEQVRDGVNGFLVSDDDPADMARRVEFLLRHPKKRAVFGEAARRIAREEFSMQGMVSDYLNLFTRESVEAESSTSMEGEAVG